MYHTSKLASSIYFTQMLKELCTFACIDAAGINVLLIFLVCDDSSVDTNTTY